MLVASLFFQAGICCAKNSFLSRLERHAIVNRVIRKYKQKHENFHSFFNEELIERMSVKIENNWKVNLL